MQGLNELLRVCKTGGTVSCIVATNQIQPFHWQGDYPFDGARRLQELYDKEEKIYFDHIHNHSDLLQSDEWSCVRTPKLFDTCGLKNIHIYPMGTSICYSDTQYPLEYRKRLIETGISQETSWISERFTRSEEKYNEFGFTKPEVVELLDLLKKKQDYLLQNLETDKSFEWEGGFNFIVTGVK